MNAPVQQVAQKRANAQRLREIIDEFRKNEIPLIDGGKIAFGDLLRDALPRLQSYALETGEFVGKMTIEVDIDLTPDGKKTIRLRAVSTPPPWKLETSAEVRPAA